MKEFELKAEHIKVMSELNFKTTISLIGGDRYIPTVDRKRPFGNSGITSNVLEILGRNCDDETGEYKAEDVDMAERLIIELPVALEIVMRNKTFEPGTYEVNEYSAYYNYMHIRNYKLLEKPLREIEKTIVFTDVDAEHMEKVHEVCMNVSGDDPWKVIDDLKWFTPTEFLEKVIKVFEKYKPEE